MNAVLYNALVGAHNFWVQDEKNCEVMKQCEDAVRLRQYEYAVHTPPFKEEEIDRGTALFWLWVFFPVGLIYIFYTKRKNEANRKKHERKTQEILHSQAEMDYRNCKAKEIEEAKNALARENEERDEYYRINYQKYLSFLPEWLRSKEQVDSLIPYVKTGKAKTLDEAVEYRARDLIELDEIQERREERKERERQHRETQETLRTIAKNQEKINHELETANKYRNGTYRW